MGNALVPAVVGVLTTVDFSLSNSSFFFLPRFSSLFFTFSFLLTGAGITGFKSSFSSFFSFSFTGFSFFSFGSFSFLISGSFSFSFSGSFSFSLAFSSNFSIRFLTFPLVDALRFDF
jgi:hypothetical protein